MNDNRQSTAPFGLSWKWYWPLILLQWFGLTLAIAGIMVRSSRAINDFISPSISTTWLALFALLCGLALGATVLSPRVLAVLTVAMCVLASAIYGAALYLPAWEGSLFRSAQLTSWAQQQAFLLGIWVGIPAGFGALVGHMTCGAVRDALEEWRDGRKHAQRAWWDADARPD